MPLALPGALTLLLAQAGAIAQPVPAQTSASVHDGAVIVQADDGFVITSNHAPPQPIRPAAVALGSAVHIDPTLLAAGLCQPGSDRQ